MSTFSYHLLCASRQLSQVEGGREKGTAVLYIWRHTSHQPESESDDRSRIYRVERDNHDLVLVVRGYYNTGHGPDFGL